MTGSPTRVIAAARIRRLNREPPAPGKFVLYWMQASQRTRDNHALEYAAQRANHLDLPLLTVFGLADAYPEATGAHYRFMLEGLAETKRRLERRRIGFRFLRESPPTAALRAGADAALIVCDRGYLRHQVAWRRTVARQAGREVVEVETDALVPVDEASDRAEIGARTLRPRLRRLRERYLVALRPTPLGRTGLGWGDPPGSPLPPLPERWRRQADLSDRPRGGENAARKRFDAFLARGLARYLESGRFLEGGFCSGMSPYLHFGQVSPLTLALKVAAEADAPAAAREAFLEELLVRRELAFNFVRRTENYDDYAALPPWARAALENHRRDPRPQTYSRDELEAARTADPYWNAAMTEMRRTGTLHNRLRMYWGKRILEWIPDPAQAYRTTLELNNRWFLDGRDPNSYANVGWIYGLHDHPWPERPVFGSVRSMTAGGLERKADPGAYVERIRSRFGDRVPRKRPGIS